MQMYSVQCKYASILPNIFVNQNKMSLFEGIFAAEVFYNISHYRFTIKIDLKFQTSAFFQFFFWFDSKFENP